MGTKLIFVRHGESTANLSRTFANRGEGWPLTVAGRAQAHALAARLTSEGVTRLLSSPLERARQTAEILAELFRLPVEVREELREFDVGRWEGTSADEGWAEYESVTAGWLRGESDLAVGGGESLAATIARFAPLAHELRKPGRDKTILCIGHGGLYRAVLPGFFANLSYEVASGLEFPNGGMVVGEVRNGIALCHEWCGIRQG